MGSSSVELGTGGQLNMGNQDGAGAGQKKQNVGFVEMPSEKDIDKLLFEKRKQLALSKIKKYTTSEEVDKNKQMAALIN